MSTQDNGEQVERRRRAIIVDDSRATRSVLRRMLQSLDFEVIEAGNGAEALENLRTSPPVGLALVD